MLFLFLLLLKALGAHEVSVMSAEESLAVAAKDGIGVVVLRFHDEMRSWLNKRD